MFTFPTAHYKPTFVTGTNSFSTIGVADFTVPYVNELQVAIWGCGGGAGYEGTARAGSGAAGGWSLLTVTVGGSSPIQVGDTIKVRIGGGGTAGPRVDSSRTAPGSGGGFSGIFDTTETHGNAIAISGGGAGGGMVYAGGAGGGANQDGVEATSSATNRGYEGTTTAGGSKNTGAPPYGTDGSALQAGDAATPSAGTATELAGGASGGGNARYDTTASSADDNFSGGGSGGGYYGGGGSGVGNVGAGSGGSGYANLTYITVNEAGAVGSGTSQSDTDYIAGKGIAGVTALDAEGTDGGDGLIVIRYGTDIV